MKKISGRELLFFEEKDRLRFIEFVHDLGYNLCEFAKVCNVSPSLICLIIKGHRSVSKKMQKILEEQGFKLYE